MSRQKYSPQRHEDTEVLGVEAVVVTVTDPIYNQIWGTSYAWIV